MNRQQRLHNLLTHIVLAVGAIVMILPFVWMVSMSLKPASEVLSTNWIPHQLDLGNYIQAWNAAPFGIFYRNSLIVTTVSTAGSVLIAMLAGYAFSQVRFIGRDVTFYTVLSALMIPVQAIIIPLYLILVGLHWDNTLTGLIMAYLPSAFGAFLFKQFFDSVPQELAEAAVVDGAGRLRILFSILMPLAKPVIAALGVLTFLYVWNDFFFPLIVVSSTNVQTLPLGLTVFSTAHTTAYNLLMAATTITVLPVLVVFSLLQRQFIEGLARSGIK